MKNGKKGNQEKGDNNEQMTEGTKEGGREKR